MIDVVLLGTAATMPTPERALSAAYLGCGGRAILFDCGEGTQTAMRRLHCSPMRIDIIALTHYHGDHIFGLPGLLQTMSCMGRDKPLYICGPAGLSRFLDPIMRLAGALTFDVCALEIPAGGFDLAPLGWPQGARLISFATEHRVSSAGYRFELDRAGRFIPELAEKLGVPMDKRGILQRGGTVEIDGREVRPEEVMSAERAGLSVVFSGDTAPCETLCAAAEKADLFICDATYTEDAQTDQAELYGHSTFSQAAQTALSAGAKRLWLTHFSQISNCPESSLSNAADIFPAAECGFDGKCITLRFSTD